MSLFPSFVLLPIHFQAWFLFNLFMSGHLHVWFVFGFILFFVSPFRNSSQSPAQMSSCRFVQYNADRRLQTLGGGKGAVLGGLLLPGVRTHPVLLPNNTPLKLVHARIFVELPPAEEENWIKLSKYVYYWKGGGLSFTVSIVRLAKVGSASLAATQEYLATWKALSSPAILVLR